ncbi:putative WD repeat-containing protein C2A9.03 isoform X1 [Curcuma longa]|uniref:putative WD repeat-containing protein C2A9.03 isoform X1 n=1 Tax=Curcuma longa TaxID=136217 RepID=UPI003D9F678D
MAEFLNNDLDYVLEDHSDTGYFDYFDDDEFDWDDQQVGGHGSRLEIANGTTKQNSDTSASEYRNGKDMQGIPWERLNHSRDYYREMRLKMYKNYENLLGPRDELEQECKQVDHASTFYDFYYNTRIVKSTIVHFQLRNLISATSKHDVYLVHDYSIMHWSSLQRSGKEVLNVAGKVVPTQKHCGSSPELLSRVQISAMCVKGKLLVAGGFQGELICKALDQPGVAFSTKLNDDGDITNAVDVIQSSSGSSQVVTACNDSNVRVFDAETFVQVGRLSCSWSVNSTSTSPDGRLLAIVGDNKDGLLVDPQSGKVASNLKGHFDYSFASAWHPDGSIIATGSQDKTCRLWDVRNTSHSLAVLKGRIGAIRGIEFSSDGRFMAMAEAADFIHVYDANADFSSAQEIDMFGEIAGISFSSDAEALFVGVADRTYGSLLEFRRRKHSSYLDCFL